MFDSLIMSLQLEVLYTLHKFLPRVFTSPFRVEVERSVIPAYPPRCDYVVYQALETKGPSEFDLATDVMVWFYSDAKNLREVIDGDFVYQYLEREDLFKRCLNLQDGEAIRKKGPYIFRRFFKDERPIFLWKSVVKDVNGNIVVPYLCVRDGLVVVDWRRFHRINGHSISVVQFMDHV